MQDLDRKIRLGQRLSVGFDGYTIPEEYRRLIQEQKIGNVILFRRNVESFAQLKRLCGELNALILGETGFPPFIMMDEECGSVSRLAHLTGATPSAMAIGATDDPENAYRIGRIMGDELCSAGVNFNLAPALDCFTDPDNTVCGNRCFAVEPEKVAEFGCRYLAGLQDAGVLACGKHFPGHGDTPVDSHLSLPIVNKPEEAIRKTELVPFRAAIRAGVSAIMSAHVVFPAMEPDRVPATLSRRLLTGLLREEMGFDGLILSDAMEMKAILNWFGAEEASVQALNAGVDVALVCHSAQLAASVMERLLRAAGEGALTEENLEAHFRRITAYKRRYSLREGEEAFGTEAQRRQARDIMEASIRLLHAPDGQELPRLTKDTLFFGTLARRNALVNDDIPLNAAETFAKAFSGRYGGLAPEENPACAVAFLGRHPDLPKAVAAAKRMAESGTRLVAVSMYTPRCLDQLPDTVWKIAAWQYDDLALDALIRRYEHL